MQPFLAPVPPGGPEVLALLLKPFGYLQGVLRMALMVVLAFLYTILLTAAHLLVRYSHFRMKDTYTDAILQGPIPPVHRTVSHAFTAVCARLSLLVAGLWWIPVEVIKPKRGCAFTTDLPFMDP